MLNGLVVALNFDQATWINLDPAKLTPEDKLRRDFAILYNKVVLDTMLIRN